MPKRKRGLAVVRNIMDASYPLLLLMWVFTVLAFGVLYYALAVRFPEHAPYLPDTLTPLEMFLDCVYFSVVTAMTVGYGDIVPMGASKLLASVEAFLAYFVMAMLISKVLGARQEAALDRVHRLSLHDAYHRIREGLYLFRRDCETITEAVERTGSLPPRMVGILATAFAELQNVLGSTTELYDREITRMVLDAKREQVLIEAMRRTMDRLVDLLDVLRLKKISLKSHPAAQREFVQLMAVARVSIRHWQEGTHNAAPKQFMDLKRSLAKLDPKEK